MLRRRPKSSVLQSNPYGLLDGRVYPIRAVEEKGLSRQKRWLCKKARSGAIMRLSCMHQKWMAQVDGTYLACGQHFTASSGFGKVFRSS